MLVRGSRNTHLFSNVLSFFSPSAVSGVVCQPDRLVLERLPDIRPEMKPPALMLKYGCVVLIKPACAFKKKKKKKDTTRSDMSDFPSRKKTMF